MFPAPVTKPLENYYPGISIRDYFAAKAMQGMMTSARYTGIIGVNNYEHSIANQAYQMADAMLKARET